jgi:hypothetical protein
MGHGMRFGTMVSTGIAAIAIAGCGSKANTAGSKTAGSSSTAGDSGLTFRYPSCQTTDNDWDVTAVALIQSGNDASYDSTAGNDAGVLASDLRQLASEASSANQAPTALIYQSAATLFQGDATLLPTTGQTPTDTGGFINAAGTQLQADCALRSFKPSHSIEGPASGKPTDQATLSTSTTTPSVQPPPSATAAAGPSQILAPGETDCRPASGFPGHLYALKGKGTCAAALRVLSDYFGGRGVWHYGQSAADSYKLVDGWHCAQSTGLAACWQGALRISGPSG